jgi:retinoid hydroxylase
VTIAPLPPGSLGFPLLGETPAFLRNIFLFLEQRRQRYGNVFKSSALGRKIVFLAGIDGAEAFYDPENISRADAHPYPLVAMFGGINMEMYDGPRHQALKAMALTAFDHAALAGYLPELQRLIQSTLQRLSAEPEWSGVIELRRLAIESICSNVMGLEPGADTESLTHDYGFVLKGILSPPLPLPGTHFAKGRAARDRILAKIRAVIAERRAAPGNDGLSRMLTATAADGRTYSDAEALLEVHHMVIAGFVVYALLAESLRHLALQPELRERCVEEVQAHAPGGPLTMTSLAPLRLCTNVILEAKRWTPLVPLAFGRARRSFSCGGFRVPEGWTVYLALFLNNRDASIYADPDRFDPDRFGPGRAEHRKHALAFIPQGAEPPTGHRCLGLDYSTVLGTAFLALLLRGYEWELPPQNLEYNWKTVPPVPVDGLRVRLRPRA